MEASTGQIRKTRRLRPRRKGIYYCEVIYETQIAQGQFNERVVVKEIHLEDAAIKASMDFTFEKWLKGNIEPTMVRGASISAAVTKKAKSTLRMVDKKTNKIKYHGKEEKLTKAYVGALKYYRDVDHDGYEEDDNGKAIKPWMHVVFQDGSQIDLILVKKRGS